ncbi:transcription-repair coupling factor [Thermoanaerobacterium sp. CMT5567-10]|uniref:transcription-repair coupling factor n=1 Tax=Thermoanaerobacterium sp. CMT5567-10 TaxID=3061989 RepID=UPI00287F5619|nr:transcription-repair coupling factor [Thermoanaerobacterium sp. CMT5567-10]WKV07775.2 transcription-repair coupling factor [Thermoanaerobacterium sp. CMT5567-10]
MFIKPIENLKEIAEIDEAIEKERMPLLIYGLTDSQKAHIAHYIIKKLNKKVLFITYDDVEARAIYEDLISFLNGDAYLIPSRDALFYKVDASSLDLIGKRLIAVKKIIDDKPSAFVASIDGVLNKVASKDIFLRYRRKYKVGDIIDLEELSSSLVTMGYERVPMVEGKGQFSIRGGIIDFFSPMEDEGFRIELFDDVIDSIRSFDVFTQRSLNNLSEVELFPAREFILEDENIKKGMENLSSNVNSYVSKIKETHSGRAEKIKKKFDEIMENISETKSVPNIGELISFFYDRLYSIVDYFDDAFIILDENIRVKERASNILTEFNENFKSLLLSGEVLPEQSNLLFSYDDILKKLSGKSLILMNTIVKSDANIEVRSIVNFVSRSMHPFHGKLELLVDDIKFYRKSGYKVVMLSSNLERGRILRDSLISYGLDVPIVDDEEYNIPDGGILIYPGTISKGFEYVDAKFALISDVEIFGQSRKPRKSFKVKNGNRIKNFTELTVGSYVVHVNYGIGKYEGIEKITFDGVTKDYLKIKYAGDDKLFIPVDQLDLIQKYIGPEDKPPKLNKLGGNEWSKLKKKAKKAVEDLAKDLIKLYAKRQTMKGYAFSKDTPWQKDFEERFPYEETEDQLRCIEEIKKDMESDKPMDRLLCGDVGYGKTEVALRAAFKAVADGKQVAFLCPTTILAEQHYNNFVQRFKDFPVKIEMLSRFRSYKEQSQIIKSLAEGTIDILVGTHKILQNDVKFKDLGLLIIDEEQRFGVKHKEKIKKLKENIDVLSLSATPIPRTLHMSLIGIRDMSVIENPPEDRYPVQTYVVEFNEDLIRDAILRELGRGGQVYFVYNRIEGIERMASIIKELVPNARVAVAHGQMEEGKLENIMIGFLNGDYDILVCTTIIETGLDIPNVNTIIVYDSDRMGLSQLYQLRGRVGRSNRLAYAYFTYRKDKVITEVAEKRLEAIKEFTEFGSGFKIAMRDLEIRGAGNLLGAEQHGHIDAIGYDMYLRLLDEAIKGLKGEVEDEKPNTTIDIKVSAYIDKEYIEDENQRLEMYKKISSIENEKDVEDIKDELIDRFKEYPKAVEALIDVAYLKALARDANILEISERGTSIILKFKDSKSINSGIVDTLVNEFRGRIMFSGQAPPYITYKYNKKENVLKELINLVNKIKCLQIN